MDGAGFGSISQGRITTFGEKSPRGHRASYATDANQTLAGGNPAKRKSMSEETEMKNLIARFVREEEGQDLIEYSLLAALISVACITIMGLVAGEIQAVFQIIIDAMPG